MHDFRLLSGLAIFVEVAAEVIYREHRGSTVMTLAVCKPPLTTHINKLIVFKDLLDAVAESYSSVVTLPNTEHTASWRAHVGFFHYIHDRSRSPDWDTFRPTLCSRIEATMIAELPAASIPRPPREPMASSPAMNENHVRPSNSSSQSPAVSQRSGGNLATGNGAVRDEQGLQLLVHSAAAPNGTTDNSIYTMLLNNYALKEGETVDYRKVPGIGGGSWGCVGTMGDLTAQTTDRNFKQARHMVSKQLCLQLGLSI